MGPARELTKASAYRVALTTGLHQEAVAAHWTYMLASIQYMCWSHMRLTLLSGR